MWEAAGWAAGVDVLIEDLSDLCENGHPDAVAALAEHAHRRADAAVNYVDDSDGYLQGISSRLAELHLESCIEGSIDPVELAGRLLEVELGAELDGFYHHTTDPDIYAGQSTKTRRTGRANGSNPGSNPRRSIRPGGPRIRDWRPCWGAKKRSKRRKGLRICGNVGRA